MRMRARYGMRYGPPPTETPPAPVAAAQVKTGPVILLEEKPLRVTMTVESVRLREAESKEAAPKAAKPKRPPALGLPGAPEN